MAVDKKKRTIRNNNWTKKNRERIEVLVPIGMKDEWKAKAQEEGLTMAQWIIKKCQGD